MTDSRVSHTLHGTTYHISEHHHYRVARLRNPPSGPETAHRQRLSQGDVHNVELQESIRFDDLKDDDAANDQRRIDHQERGSDGHGPSVF